MSQIVGIPDIPRIRAINCSVIWEDIKNDPIISMYFPSIFVQSTRVPNREYMFNVILRGVCRTSA